MSSFKDHFSSNAPDYARFRPGYPKELFAFLASLTQGHSLAWDCGTGNGQAAVELAEYYDKVIASDPSPEQIKNAFSHEKVEYRVETAESNSIESHSLDLLVASNSMHWFNFDLFFREVRRVLKPGGIIAVFAYGKPFVNDQIDPVITHFHDEVVGEFWQHENRLVENEYRDVPFPFPRIPAPEFIYEKEVSPVEMTGFFSTWSAVQRYRKARGIDPIPALKERLLQNWPERQEKVVMRWRLILRVGRP